MTGDLILPYFFQHISETLYPTTVEFDTPLMKDWQSRSSLQQLLKYFFNYPKKAVQSSVILGAVLAFS